MNIFISGGCKNGKSMYAQMVARDLARMAQKPLYYLATMIPTDEEDRARIARHISERDGWGFETIEKGRRILDALEHETTDGKPVDAGGAFLLDSVTALLSNEMFREDGSVDFTAGDRLAVELSAFAERTGNTVFVSDYIYSDARRFDTYTESYREELAKIDRTLASVCDQVVEVAFGLRYEYK